MSWDIFVQDIPENVQDIDDIPDDFTPKPIGKRSWIIAEIRKVVPFVDFSDPSWGIIEGENFSIEINLGESDTVDSFAFHVRGGNEVAIGIIADILASLRLRALDSAAGTLFDPAQAVVSMRQWQTYRDRIVNAG